MAEFRIVGLTGGIASGKSLVAKFLAAQGLAVVDADQVSRALSAEGGAAHPAIVKRFGTADRARLREIVFADAAARKDLEAILHPLIRSASMERLRAEVAKPGRDPFLPVIYEATLLVETGRYSELDGLITVQAPLEERIRRLVARDGMDEGLARKIIAAQLSDEDRKNAADFVLENGGTPEALRAQVLALIPRLHKS
jgi:dephospho-CoA kinase